MLLVDGLIRLLRTPRLREVVQAQIFALIETNLESGLFFEFDEQAEEDLLTLLAKRLNALTADDDVSAMRALGLNEDRSHKARRALQTSLQPFKKNEHYGVIYKVLVDAYDDRQIYITPIRGDGDYRRITTWWQNSQ